MSRPVGFRLFFWIVGALFVLGVFGAGVMLGTRLPAMSRLSQVLSPVPNALTPLAPPTLSDVAGVDSSLFGQVWASLHERYYKREQVQDKDLFYGSIAGLAASLEDPYTVFFDPKTAQKFSQDLSGKFEGIGAEIGIKNDRLAIIAPLPASPAEKAGLRAGDLIWSINKVDTSGITLEKAVSLIRGPAGTSVTLAITREGFRAVKDIIVNRERIDVKSVTWKILPATRSGRPLGYIKIAQFNDDTQPLLEEAVQKILPQRVAGLIVDLRNNPGGLLDSAVSVGSLWIPSGPIVKERFSGEPERSHEREGLLLLDRTPTVLLVNRGSASAAEIVAGALQDYNRATVLGEKTFGKGSVQELQPFTDGSALKVTVATWYTPKGRQINELGIAPDIEVVMKSEDYDKNLDPQLARAVQVLVNQASK